MNEEAFEDIKKLLDPDCKDCQKTLREIIKYYSKISEECYGCVNMRKNRKIKAFKLKPDYNASHIITHFHIYF